MSENETPVLPEGNQEGTTTRLFPDTVVPAQADQQEVAAEVPQEEPVTETPEEPDYIDLDALGEKKVKVKIDGVESIVPLRELHKGYQKEQYLTVKGQQLAEERKYLESLKNQLLQVIPPAQQQEEEDPLKEVINPYVSPILEEISTLKQQINMLSQVAAPYQYQQALNAVDAHLKKEGFDDFKNYVPKLEAAFQVASPEEQAFLNTGNGAIAFYFREKAKELKQSLSAKPKQADPRPAPKVTPIESGTSTPSGQESIDMQALFERARKTGDWTAVYEAKGCL